MSRNWLMPSRKLAKDSGTKGRQCKDWIKEYLDYVQYTEPPTNYHRWVAIGCLAAALQRRVYFDWGVERIFPNLYIVLLGAAAQTRKSTALRIGEEFIRALHIPIIGQDNSKESVIRDIQKSSTSFNDGTIIRTQSAVVCFASELAVFLGKQDTEFQAYLTDWYDSPEKWKRSTKHQGVDDISGLSFNLIGAMAPDWIPHVFTPESIGGGFTSRIMFVTEYRKAHTIANPNKYPLPNGRRDRLLADLQVIQTNITGQYTFSQEASDFYEEWYTEDDRKLQLGEYAVNDRSFHSYCGRRPTMLRKLSMCIAASRSNELVISLRDIKEALGYMEDIETRMPGTFAAVGRSSLASAQASFIHQIKIKGKLLRSEFLRTMSGDMSFEDMEAIERVLDASKYVRVTRLTEKNDTLYELIDDSFKQFV
jgi:hypothetical protein